MQLFVWFFLAKFGYDPNNILRLAFCDGNCDVAGAANFSDPITRYTLDANANAGEYAYLEIPTGFGTPSINNS